MDQYKFHVTKELGFLSIKKIENEFYKIQITFDQDKYIITSQPKQRFLPEIIQDFDAKTRQPKGFLLAFQSIFVYDEEDKNHLLQAVKDAFYSMEALHEFMKGEDTHYG